MKETSNSGALAGISEAPQPKQEHPDVTPEPAKVDMAALIAGVRAALAAEGNPEMDALRAKLAAQEVEMTELRRRADEKQLADRHRSGANESHASSKERFGMVIDESQDPNAVDPVFVQVNGRAYSIKRGRYVEVPKEVMSVLNDAVQTATTPIKDGNGHPTGRSTVRHARRFPYQNFGLCIDATGKRIKEPQVDSIDT